MAIADIEKLIEHLRFTSRTRVGLWRVPLNSLGHEAEIAVQLGIQAQDIGAYLRTKVQTGAEFVRLSPQKIWDRLDEITSMPGKDCVLIYNLDLLLAGIKSEERQALWQDLFNGFPNRKRILLLTVPEKAAHLLPSDALLERWQKDSRLQ